MKGRKWSSREDDLLRERVLECITNGGTQLEAFEEVGKKIGRTSGACGFRWNAVLRQQDPVSFSEAKKKRVHKELQKRKGLHSDSMSQIVFSLKSIGKQCRSLRTQVQELSGKRNLQESQLKKMSAENKELYKETNSLAWYQKEVKDKYKDLIHLLEKDEVTNIPPKIEHSHTEITETVVDTKST